MVVQRFILGLLSSSILITGSQFVSSQEYPNKTIRVITAGAGSGGDFTARLIAPGLSARLTQPVIIDNRTGVLAAEAVAKAPPDGYTLNVAGGANWITPLLQKTSYDPGDFSPISQLVREVFLIAVHPSLAVSSVKELIALAKARPGELNYASGATGGSSHLGAALFRAMAGIDIVHVPYKGNAPQITAVISGESQLTISDMALLMPHVKSGKLRALAVTTAEPSPLAPGLPTVSSSGLPGYEMTTSTGIFAPTRTPGPIVNRLNQEVVRVLNLPDVKDRFLNAGVETLGNSPEQFSAAVKSDIAKWSKVIRDAGIKPD